MKSTSLLRFRSWLSAIHPQVWILAIGRFLSEVGTGFTLLFTTYISQLHSTLPLYFKNFVPNVESYGFAETTISKLFAWHLVVAILAQLPMARVLNRFSHTIALSISSVVWAIGFSLIWLTDVSTSGNIGIYIGQLWL